MKHEQPKGGEMRSKAVNNDIYIKRSINLNQKINKTLQKYYNLKLI